MLSRKVNQKIVIGDGITIPVVSIQGDKVRLEIDAHRKEVYKAIAKQNDEHEATANEPQ